MVDLDEIKLDPSDIDTFNTCGYLVVKNAFSKKTAALCREKVWEHMGESHGVYREDQSSWVPKVSLDRVWMKSDGTPWQDVFTDK